jgi:serine/threonine-protein kinase
MPEADQQVITFPIKPQEIALVPREEPSALIAKQLSGEPKHATTEVLCGQESWPTDKPQAKIVFPRIITGGHLAIASLWTMLDATEITNRRSSTRYNQFLFIEIPHPMLLWITVLYNRKEGARWLPCYLDLKTEMGQQMTRLLAQRGQYSILLFAMGEPQKYRHITQATIAEKQREQLFHWAEQSHGLRATDPKVSKQQLKQEYEKLKGAILVKLEAVHTNSNVVGH